MSKVATFKLKRSDMNQLVVTVKVSRMFRFTLWLGMLIARLGAWIVGFQFVFMKDDNADN